MEFFEISTKITYFNNCEMLVGILKYWYNVYANIVDARG